MFKKLRKQFYRNLLFISCLAFVSCSQGVLFPLPAKAADTPPNPVDKKGWVLTKGDEFNGSSLNTSLWISRYLGFRTTTDRGNAQYQVANGSVTLNVTADMPTYSSDTNLQVSALQTAQGDFNQNNFTKDHDEPFLDKFSQEYGYFEIRAKPSYDRSGEWTFWANSVEPGYFANGNRPTDNLLEIDSAENYRGNNYNFNLLLPQNWSKGTSYKGTYSFTYDNEWHIYALEWTPTKVRYYVDNNLVKELDGNRVLAKQMFFYIALYVNSWGGDGSTPSYPVQLSVDYFRAYKRADNLGLTATATSTNSSTPPANLIDGDTSTTLTSNNNPTFPQYVTLTWPTGQDFNHVDLSSWYAQGQAPSNWDIEVSDDGSTNWTQAASSGNVTWQYNDSTVETKTVTFNKVYNKKGVRIKINNANLTWSHYSISELAIKDDVSLDNNFNSGESTGVEPSGYAVDRTGGTATVEAIPSTTDYSVKLSKANSSSSTKVGIQKEFNALSGVVNVEARVRSDTSNWYCLPYLYDSNGNVAASIAFDGGNIKANVSGTWQTVQSYTTGTWYELKLVLNTDTDLFDLYINNTKKLSQVALRTPVSNISMIQFYQDNAFTGTAYVDNVKVYK